MKPETYAPAPYGTLGPYSQGAALSFLTLENYDGTFTLPPQDQTGFGVMPTDPMRPTDSNLMPGKTSNAKTIYVEDTDTGKPLANVNVYVKGNTANGAVTDANGNVTISANPGDTIVFSHVGYATKERIFGDLGGSQNLDKKVEELNEASVIGGGKKTPWGIILASVGGIFLASYLLSDGNTGKTGLNGKKKGKKGKKKAKKTKTVTV